MIIRQIKIGGFDEFCYIVGSDRAALGVSIRRLMELPEETVVWPGHDYGPTPYSTLGWEKRHNVNAKEYGFYKEG